MVGALQRFEADIGGSPLFVRTDRAEALDYAAQIWQTRVWYCIVAFLVLSSTILGLMLRLNRIKIPSDEEDESTSLAVLFILGTYYNATVVSSLLRDPPKNIRNMKELLKSNLVAGIEDELYIKDFLKAKVGMQFVKRGGFAFHVDSAVAYRIMKRSFSERELCEATEVIMYVPQYLGA
ncbi:Uncharacterized protein OBRU01_17984, partial [Operophtera brumata]